jgi:hypothetical protein
MAQRPPRLDEEPDHEPQAEDRAEDEKPADKDTRRPSLEQHFGQVIAPNSVFGIKY